MSHFLLSGAGELSLLKGVYQNRRVFVLDRMFLFTAACKASGPVGFPEDAITVNIPAVLHACTWGGGEINQSIIKPMGGDLQSCQFPRASKPPGSFGDLSL